MTLLRPSWKILGVKRSRSRETRSRECMLFIDDMEDDTSDSTDTEDAVVSSVKFNISPQDDKPMLPSLATYFRLIENSTLLFWIESQSSSKQNT